MFSGYTVSPDGKETELRSSDQVASPSAGKNTRVVLVPCREWKCTAGVDISEVPHRNIHTIRRVLSEAHKNYFKDWCLMNTQPTFVFFDLFLSQ